MVVARILAQVFRPAAPCTSTHKHSSSAGRALRAVLDAYIVLQACKFSEENSEPVAASRGVGGRHAGPAPISTPRTRQPGPLKYQQLEERGARAMHQQLGLTDMQWQHQPPTAGGSLPRSTQRKLCVLSFRDMSFHHVRHT